MAQASLADVDALSDDERFQPRVGPAPALQIVQPHPAPKRLPGKRKTAQVVVKEVDVKMLRHKVEGSCGCLCRCFIPLRGQLFDQLLKIRKTLSQLEKPEQDNYVNSSD